MRLRGLIVASGAGMRREQCEPYNMLFHGFDVVKHVATIQTW